MNTARAVSDEERPTPVFEPVRRHLDELAHIPPIAQHARGSRPDPEHGTCTDDVVRLIEVDGVHGARLGWAAVEDSVQACLDFLREALVPETGRFRNVRSTDGAWLDDGSDDAQGRALLALGALAARGGSVQQRQTAAELFSRALANVPALHDLRPRASVLLACVEAAETSLRVLVEPIADEQRAALVAMCAPLEGSAWPWPEPVLTYETPLVPRALIRAGHASGDAEAQRLGLAILDWYLASSTTADGRLSFVGNRGWWPKGEARARFDQQPIEASSLFLAVQAAFETTGRAADADGMRAAYRWFLGANDLGVPIAIPTEGSCHDGLNATGVNPNQGAESTLAWLLVAAHIADAERRGLPATDQVAGQLRT